MKRGMMIAGGIAAGSVATYKAGEQLHRRSLERKMPEGGDTQSIYPFMNVALDYCSQNGLEVEFLGGPAKQALCDEETEFIVESRLIKVSDDPMCRTNKRATLYRPNSTIRDLDIFVKKVDGSPANPEIDDLLAHHAYSLQETLNQHAEGIGYPRGPEISLFHYESPFDGYRLRDYATRTLYDKDGEIMVHSLGAKQFFEPQDNWTLGVQHEDKGMLLPTTSPARSIGRTLVRCLKARERDLQDALNAVENISNQGLHEELLGLEWERYLKLRNQLDESLRLDNIYKNYGNKPRVAGKLVLANLIAPLAPIVEESYIADMFQDPDSPVYRTAAKIMGAKETKGLR